MDQEYRTVAHGCGWRPRRERGRLRFAGADRVSFLQALLTNDVSSLREGAGVYAAYLTPQGRMVADLLLFNDGDAIVAAVPATTAARLAQTFDGLIFSEDVRVNDESDAVRQLMLLGPRAVAILADALGADETALDALQAPGCLRTSTAVVMRTDDAPGGSWEVFVPAAIEEKTIASLERAGAVRVSDGLADALRIDRGRPEWGRDMDEDTIPLEAGLLERAISMSKGCYVGQEVIVRVLHRGGGRVAKRLVRMSGDAGETSVPSDGAAIVRDGRDVGRVTSAAWSPREQRVVVLAYVTRDVAEPGNVVVIGDGSGTMTARITAVVS